MKASNQSDLMQHNVPTAFFNLEQYSMCSSRLRGMRRGVFFTPAVSPSHCASLPHTTIIHYAWQYGVRSVCLTCFGDMFQWRKSLVCCFGALICNWRAATSIALALTSFSLAPMSFVLAPQQMAALNFVHFNLAKLFCKIDREVTSNIKFKKYKIVNKKVLIEYVLF